LKNFRDIMDRGKVHSETMSLAVSGTAKGHRKVVGLHRKIIKIVTLH